MNPTGGVSEDLLEFNVIRFCTCGKSPCKPNMG